MDKLGNITLIYDDCMNVICDLPDKCFDLAIVDPPYGIGECGSNNKSRSKLAMAKDYHPFAGNDKKSPSADYFHHLFRVSKNQIIWGANHFIEKVNKNSSCWIVWDKDNGNNSFADCELAWTSFKTAVRKFKYRWNGMLQENMANKEFRIHPTQKPCDLYRWILINYAKPGDKILDTHLGSGSICIACDEMGFENVHHKKYIQGAAPWEYDTSDLITLCEDCHAKYHRDVTKTKIMANMLINISELLKSAI